MDSAKPSVASDPMPEPTTPPVPGPEEKPLATPSFKDQIVVSPVRHHYVRTILSSFFGVIALNLVLASILVVWLGRTLTDTDTYVTMVAPLAAEPDIQEFIAAKTTDQLMRSASAEEIAAAVLPPDDIDGRTPEQLKMSASAAVDSSVVAALESPKFQTLWQETNRTAHAQVVRQLSASTGQLSVDVSPFVSDALAVLQTTDLAPIADQVDIPDNAGVIKLDGPGIQKAQEYYRLLHTATLVLLGVTLIAASLCVMLSVHHARTFRRILFGTALSTLSLTLLIQVPTFVSISAINPADQRAAAALAGVLFHDLRIALLTIGVTCIVLATVSKIASKRRAHAAIV